MLEYKVVTVNVKNAEQTMNELAQEGWQVVSASAVAGMGLSTNSTPLVITLERGT